MSSKQKLSTSCEALKPRRKWKAFAVMTDLHLTDDNVLSMLSYLALTTDLRGK